MRRIMIICLCILIILMPGCGPKNGANGPELGIGTEDSLDFNQKLTVYISEVTSYADEQGSVQTLSGDTASHGAYLLGRLNAIIKDNGFHIEFKPIPYGVIDPEWDQDEVYNYSKICMKYAAKLVGENTVLLLPSARMAPALAGVHIHIEDQALSLSVPEESFLEHAPKYYEAVDQLKDTALPVGLRYRGLNRAALILHNEIAREYGEEINTLDEYEQFLLWAKEHYPDKMPSLIPILGTDNVFTTISSELENLIGGSLPGFSLNYMLRMDIGYLLEEDGDGRPVYTPVEKSAEFAQAVKRILGWRDKGLIEFADGGNLSYAYRWEDYCSILINTAYYNDDYPKVSTSLGEMNDYAYMEETPYILYNGLMPDLRDRTGPVFPISVSYIGRNTNEAAIAEWLRFLEWMTQDVENYRKVTWGAEGVEYELSEDKEYVPLPYVDETGKQVQEDYRVAFKALFLLRNEAFAHTYTKYFDAPLMERAVTSLSFPDNALLSSLHEHADQLQSLSEDPVYASALLARQRAYKLFIEKIPALQPDQVDAHVTRFIQEREKEYLLIEQFFNIAQYD